MKPNFALQLSNDGAQLLHRAGAHWAPVGAVSFDADDVAAACARLVAAAKALAPEGMRTKLVIPPSEIRYELVSAPGPTDEARRYQIEAEIERLTPYVVDELGYDFAIEDDSVLVAICARETLVEAETFAEGYGFNPVSFVAIPEAGQFSGEPWFGETSVATAHMPAGAHVQRDSEPVRIVTAAARPGAGTPAQAPAPVAKPALAPAASARPASAAARPVGAAVAAAASPVPPMAKPVVPPPQRPATTQASQTTDAGFAKVGDLVRRVGNRLRREQAEQITAARHQPAPVAPAASLPAAPPAAASLPVTKPQPAAEPAAPDAGAAPVAFASRRHPAPVVAASGARPDPAGPGPGGRIAVLPGAQPARSAVQSLVRQSREGARSALSRLAALRPAPKPAKGPPPVVPASRPPTSEQERSREIEALTIFGARGNPVRETGMARRGLLAAGALLLLLMAVAVWTLYFSGNGQTQLADAGSDAGTLPQIVPPESVATLAAPPATVTEPLARPEAVAAPDPATTTAVTAPAVEPVAPVAEVRDVATTADPEQLAEDLAAAARDETLPVPTDAQAGDPQVLPGADPVAAVAAVETPVGTPAEAPVTAPADPLTTAPQTSTAVAAQPADPQSGAAAGSEIAEVVLSEVPEQRLSLPGPIATPPLDEVAFVPPPPPPPFGSSFVFDDGGLVRATPEGALTPSGVTVFARRPSVAPVPAPGRPPVLAAESAPVQAPTGPVDIASAVESALTEAVAGTEATTAPDAASAGTVAPAGTEVVFDDTPRADPALAGARPQAPPARVQALRQQATPQQPAAPAQEDDQTSLPDAQTEGPTDTAALETPPPGGVLLTALRPQRRPTDLVAAADPGPAPQTIEEPSLDLAGATPEAVAASPIPGARPTSVQERARAILAAASAPRPQAGTATDLEDESDEPASTAAAPSIPTTASVARQATETDAIDLAEVNLIGVFGTPNDRRALVRLSSGRVVRVAVGDRLDGGQVTAIGESELRYTASGSNRILRIGG